MSRFISFRVDDRLIHGQVMVGWVRSLGIRQILLANDEVALDQWRKETLRTVVDSFTDEVQLKILSLNQTLKALANGDLIERAMLLVESVRDAFALYQQGLGIEELNLGGIHSRAGRLRLLPFLYLDPEEMELVTKLCEQGIRVIARDFPDSKAVDVANLIKRKR